MPEQLKPCPFCGVVPNDMLGDMNHMCRVLGVSIAASRDEWNTRAPLPCDGCTDALCLRDAGCPRGLKAE